MGLQFNILSILLTFASLQGVMLGVMLLSAKRFRRKSNIGLALALFSTSLIILGNVFENIGLKDAYPSLSYFPLFLTMTIPAGTYYFVKFLINEKYTLTAKDYFIIAPAIIQFLGFTLIFIAYLIYPEPFSQNYERYKSFRFADEWISIVYCFVLLFFALSLIINYQKKLLDNFTSIESMDLRWLKILLIIILFLCVCWTIAFVYVLFVDPTYRMYPVWFGMAVIMYAIGYIIYLRRNAFESASFNTKEEVPKLEKLSEKTDDHYQRLIQLMNVEKLYQKPELNMTMLAEEMSLSNGYLSQIINQKEKVNFFDFVNKYRVEMVKSKLTDPKFDHYSILAIGLDSGFKSKSTFNSVFKRMVGKTPSAYKKELN